MNNHGEPPTTGELHEPLADDTTPRPSRVRRVLSAPGRLVGSWIDASELAPARDATGENVLNGVASDPEDPTILYLTGKLGPHMYRVRVDGLGG